MIINKTSNIKAPVIQGETQPKNTDTAVAAAKSKSSATVSVDKTAFKKALEQRLTEIGQTLSLGQIDQLTAYYELLVETNRVMNLTGIVEPEAVAEKHMADSLRLLKYLTDDSKTPVKTIIDVGTGAGLPGIPLAVARPDCHILLLDSQQKRCRFLENVCQKLDLQNVEIIWGRAEELGQQAAYRQKLDLAVARAVAAMPTLLEYLAPFVQPGGKIIALKGNNVQKENTAAAGAMKELKLKLEKTEEYHLAGGEERSLVVLKKTGLLSAKYPRKSGLIKKNPL